MCYEHGQLRSICDNVAEIPLNITKWLVVANTQVFSRTIYAHTSRQTLSALKHFKSDVIVSAPSPSLDVTPLIHLPFPQAEGTMRCKQLCLASMSNDDAQAKRSQIASPKGCNN